MATMEEITIFVFVVYIILNCVVSEMALHVLYKAALTKEWHSNTEER